MRRSNKLAGVGFAVVLLAAGARAAAQGDAQGDWLASLNVAPTAVLHLAFHFKAADGGPIGTMDSLDQGVNDVPLARVVTTAASGRLRSTAMLANGIRAQANGR